MKLTPVFASAALALLSVMAENVTDTCTEADFWKVLDLTDLVILDPNCFFSDIAVSNITTSFSSSSSSSLGDIITPTCPDDDTFECSNVECYPTYDKVAKDMPDCVSKGANIKQLFQQQLADCKANITSGANASNSNTTKPDATKSAATDRSFPVAAAIALSTVTAATIALIL